MELPDFTRSRRFRPAPILFALAAVFVSLGLSAFAADVAASLSQNEVGAGDPVRLQIRIDGGRPESIPRDFRVDGLEISYNGASQSNQLSFGSGGIKSISTVILNYTVVARRPGSYTIPGIDVPIDGRVLKTQPIGLRVEPGSGGGGANPGNPGTPGNAGGQSAPLTDKWSFAEIVVPKQTAYVGETLPVEFRLYVDTRINWQPESMPDFEAEGFTKTKMPEPRQEQSRRDGKDYTVLVFKTAITPTKAGKVRLGPSTITFNAQVPRAKPKRQRSPFGDVFGDDFFNDPSFFGFGAWERRKATAEVVELNIKPLPAVGVPDSFSGAVGKFKISSSGLPKEVKIGDPLTMTVQLEGRGNFDRVNAPVLKDPAGWRAYPPSNNFVPDDDVSFRGSKNFQFAIVPETRKTTMPQFEFTYFDPEAEKYVTLLSDPLPLKVNGSAAPIQPTPPKSTTASAPKPADLAPAPEPSLTDILANRYDSGNAASFSPVYEQPGFWIAQALPAAALLGLVFRRILSRSDAAARAAALKREKGSQRSRLEREKSRIPFLEAATRTIQIDTALITGQEPSTVDAVTACRSRQLDQETIETIEAIFQSRAEALYAGGALDGGVLPTTERDRFLQAVKQFERSHGLN